MVKAVIIGCGKIAGGYDDPCNSKVRTHAKAYRTYPQCKLVGVSDINKKTAQAFANTWGVDDYFVDYRAMLKHTQPDIVSICAPTPSHDAIFKSVCETRPRYIWLEKPASTSAEGVKSMIALAKAAGTTVWMNYFRRYDAGFKRVKALIQTLGLPLTVQAFYTKGLKHNGCHMLDILNYFFGRVRSFDIYDAIEDDDYLTISAYLYFDKLKVNLVGLDHRNFELFEMDLIFKNARVRILDGGQVIEFYEVTNNKYYAGYKNLSKVAAHSDSYGEFMLQGLKAGLSGEPMPTLQEELFLAELTDSILKTRVSHGKAYI